jgi:hypothetical protein
MELDKTSALQPAENTKRTPPSLTVENNNNCLNIEIDGDFDRISNEVTSKSVAFGLIGQIVSLGSRGNPRMQPRHCYSLRWRQRTKL